MTKDEADRTRGDASAFATELGPEIREGERRERMRAAEVPVVERMYVEAVGEESARERRPHDHAQSAFEREREDLVLDVADERAVLVLQRDDRPDRQRTLDLVG